MTSKGKVIKLLNKGIGKYWETRHDPGKGRAVFYCPIVQPLYIDNKTILKKHETNTLTLSKDNQTIEYESNTKNLDNITVSDCPSNIQTIKTKDKIEDSEASKEYLTHYTKQGLPLPEAGRLARIDYEADFGTWEA
jgi:hypothetical protein